MPTCPRCKSAAASLFERGGVLLLALGFIAGSAAPMASAQPAQGLYKTLRSLRYQRVILVRDDGAWLVGHIAAVNPAEVLVALPTSPWNSKVIDREVGALPSSSMSVEFHEEWVK